MNNKQSIYNEGLNNGYEIAQCNLTELNHEHFTNEDIEQFINNMIEHEQENFRQFSPFEFFAHDLNTSKNPEKSWNSYDDGVYHGIKKAINEFKKENKAGFRK